MAGKPTCKTNFKEDAKQIDFRGNKKKQTPMTLRGNHAGRTFRDMRGGGGGYFAECHSQSRVLHADVPLVSQFYGPSMIAFKAVASPLIPCQFLQNKCFFPLHRWPTLPSQLLTNTSYAVAPTPTSVASSVTPKLLSHTLCHHVSPSPRQTTARTLLLSPPLFVRVSISFYPCLPLFLSHSVQPSIPSNAVYSLSSAIYIWNT